MKKLLLTLIMVVSFTLSSLNLMARDKVPVKMVKSPDHRVALLELYTSEGCSSCPPADRFMSKLKTNRYTHNSNESGFSPKLIPMAFHVTYWDYIGWKDRFAKTQYDQRQRKLARLQRINTVYTPQFLFSGDDYRRIAELSKDLKTLTSQKATVDLEMSVQDLSAQGLLEKSNTAKINTTKSANEKVRIKINADTSRTKEKNINIYIAVIENNLTSEVEDGENEGEHLKHDYVVRQLSGPYRQTQSNKKNITEHTMILNKEWKKQDLSIVSFAENSDTGDVLQAVRLKL